MNYNNTEYNKEGKDDMASTNSSSGIDKDSSTTGTTSQDCHDSKIILDINKDYGKPGYPFPLVLRLRVLQVIIDSVYNYLDCKIFTSTKSDEVDE